MHMHMHRRLQRRTAGIDQKRVPMDPPTTRPADLFPPELVNLLGTARNVIDQHLNDRGHCADCGAAWPCQRSVLAEFTLAAL